MKYSRWLVDNRKVSEIMRGARLEFSGVDDLWTGMVILDSQSVSVLDVFSEHGIDLPSPPPH